MTKKYLYAASALVALAPISFNAMAQDKSGTRQARPVSVLNEIIVSSQRREESAQDVPISVTAKDLQKERYFKVTQCQTIKWL